MKAMTTDPRERIDWLTDNYDLSKRNANALILAELGFSHRGIAKRLDVTASTARKYLRNLEEQIGEGVTESMPKSKRFPTYPGDTPKSQVEYSADNVDISPRFKERERPINRGMEFEDIPSELVTINGGDS